MSVCGDSLFDTNFKYIKVGNGQLMAVDGANIAEKMLLADLRIPYDEITKTKFLVKSSNTITLDSCNLLGKATFLAIRVNYDKKSVIEEDNYLKWYFDNGQEADEIIYNYIGKLMVLSGNSIKRINTIKINNPNMKYDVSLEVMIASMKTSVVITEGTSVYVGNSEPNNGQD
jgi:hypothetical protein